MVGDGSVDGTEDVEEVRTVADGEGGVYSSDLEEA